MYMYLYYKIKMSIYNGSFFTIYCSNCKNKVVIIMVCIHNYNNCLGSKNFQNEKGQKKNNNNILESKKKREGNKGGDGWRLL